MYVLDDRLLTTCAFVAGFGTGRGDHVEPAFSAWLADRQPRYKNFALASMILSEVGLRALGTIDPPPLTEVEDRQALDMLCDLLAALLDDITPQ